MITLRQHVPAFVNDGGGGWKITAQTLDELLSNQAVSVYASDTEPVERIGTVTGWVGPERKETRVRVIYPAPEERRFYRWSITDRNTLMVEHNHGDYFWVVGFIKADDPSELAALPQWVETENARNRREAWNRGDTGPTPKRYRCAEHGVEGADCCLKA